MQVKIASVSNEKSNKELHNSDETENVQKSRARKDTYLQKKDNKLLMN